MSTVTSSPRSTSILSLSSLVVSVIGLVLCAIFSFTSAGIVVLYTGVIAGLAGIVLGIVALVKRQPQGLAITGLVLGSLVVLYMVGWVVFALLFIGAMFA